MLVLHEFIPKRTWRDQLDFCLHFSGGASIAFFMYHALGTFERVVGDLTRAGRNLFGYTLACTTGVFWEFGELLSDTFLGTRIQRSLRETMSDLVADATGAALALILIQLASKLRR